MTDIVGTCTVARVVAWARFDAPVWVCVFMLCVCLGDADCECQSRAPRWRRGMTLLHVRARVRVGEGCDRPYVTVARAVF